MHELDRHDTLLLGDVLRDQIHHRRIDLGLVEVNEVDAELHAQGLDQLCFRDEMLVNQYRTESLAGSLLSFQGFLKLFLGDDTDVDQHLA